MAEVITPRTDAFTTTCWWTPRIPRIVAVVTHTIIRTSRRICRSATATAITARGWRRRWSMARTIVPLTVVDIDSMIVTITAVIIIRSTIVVTAVVPRAIVIKAPVNAVIVGIIAIAA